MCLVFQITLTRVNAQGDLQANDAIMGSTVTQTLARTCSPVRKVRLVFTLYISSTHANYDNSSRGSNSSSDTNKYNLSVFFLEFLKHCINVCVGCRGVGSQVYLHWL